MDLPGQGLLPWEGKFFRPAMYVPISAVTDYALTRPEVDSKRFAAYGINSDGSFAPQTAMNDPRIKAVAVTAAVVDAERLFATMPVTTTTPKSKLVVTAFDEDASSHCIGENRRLMGEILFDWPDNVLK